VLFQGNQKGLELGATEFMVRADEGNLLDNKMNSAHKNIAIIDASNGADLKVNAKQDLDGQV
jgi:hypothetical protein